MQTRQLRKSRQARLRYSSMAIGGDVALALPPVPPAAACPYHRRPNSLSRNSVNEC
jgi:hypothetical protein